MTVPALKFDLQIYRSFSVVAKNTSPNCAPSVLILFINMVMHKTEKPEDIDPDGCPTYMFAHQVSEWPELLVNDVSHQVARRLQSSLCFDVQCTGSYVAGLNVVALLCFQEQIQTILLVISICCVPLMFVGKPLYTILSERRARRRQYVSAFYYLRIDSAENSRRSRATSPAGA